jgi:hypothetical protein
VQWGGQVVDGSFEYQSDRLLKIDQVIELTHAEASPLRAKVTGLQRSKSRPIRGPELS